MQIIEKKRLLYAATIKANQKDSMLTLAITTVQSRERIIDSLKNARQKVDQGYHKLLKYYNNKAESNDKLVESITMLKNDLANYEDKKNELDKTPAILPFNSGVTSLLTPGYWNQTQGNTILPSTYVNTIGLSASPIDQTHKPSYDSSFFTRLNSVTQPTSSVTDLSVFKMFFSSKQSVEIVLEPKYLGEVITNLMFYLTGSSQAD